MITLFKSEKKVIAEIHNAFDTAEDRLLKQADDVLRELKIETQSQIEAKAALSQQLGFVNSPVVKKSKELGKKIKINQQMAELIRFYKHNYPFQKFLTEDELDRICKKYNLIYAPTDRYNQDVPFKNLQEISKAPSLAGDLEVEEIRLLKCTNFTDQTPKGIRDELKNGIRADKVIYSNNRFCRDYFGINYDVNQYNTIYWETKRIKRNGLFIAAPQSHFNLKGLKKTSAFSFNFVIEVKDPIVFRYCKGGIQVLSKWGLEASDELLVNEIEN